MTICLRTPAGETIAQSRNLAGILRWTRDRELDEIRIDHSVEDIGAYAVTFAYRDGSRALTIWQDWRVLIDWLAARRSWRTDYNIHFAATASDIAIAARKDRGRTLQALMDRGVTISGNGSWYRVEGL